MSTRDTISSDSHQPLVSDELLKQYGASIQELDQGEMVFQQGDRAYYFHVIHSGEIEMAIYTEKGRKFVQGVFNEGQSFGEPPFFARARYPASAVAVGPSKVWRCGYDDFVRLLRENPEVNLKLTEILSNRLIYKAMMLGEIAVEQAEHRLSTIIDYFRKYEEVSMREEYHVPFTRQQLADMTGLRVETVIRTIKSMEDEGLLRIDGGKIVWIPERE
jgi:CRP-like cAMP-binding protein